MKELIKRMAEIRSRKVELRGVLETDAKADLDAIEKELRELDEEYTNLEKRKAVIEGIGAGTVPVNEVPNPINNRSADNFDQDKEYRSAWLKHVRGLDLTENEQRALTTGTSSAGAVIPTVTQNKIIEKVNQYCPLLDKIDLLRVPGGVKVPAEGTTADAAVHTEGATITADGDTLSSVTLSAYEVTKLVTISKSVEKMAIDAFESWLVNKIARKIAEKIGLKNVRILEAKENALVKLTTFVPTAQAEDVRKALFDAGCGNIGNYDLCSYNMEGEGTFRAREGATPYCGAIGELHTEREVRIETIIPAYKKAATVKALLAAHPYEEPVYDIYPLQNSWPQAGAGVIGELEVPETELEFLKRIKKTFEVGCLRHNKLLGREIQTVALCGGAGAFLMPLAIRNRADVFITGEIKYHDYFGHDTDILLAEIGHYESEQYTKEIFYTIIRDLFPHFEVQMTKVNTNPIKYM